jgi:bacteriochlorophyllide a dehydrogenase
MKSMAVVLEQPGQVSLSRVGLTPASDTDVVVDIDYSGISTGTEKLLWSGRMPMFPGMGYPLVPGYESVGRISAAGPIAGLQVGETVFVPGARCFGEVRGLFGGAASRLVVAAPSGHAHPATAWASTASCWPWRPPPITRSRWAASARPSCRRS